MVGWILFCGLSKFHLGSKIEGSESGLKKVKQGGVW